MSGSAGFRISADFVSARVALTWEELVCGYRKGWLAPDALTVLAEAGSAAAPGLPTEEERLYLFSSEIEDRVNAAVAAADVDCDDPEPNKVWMYLALARLYE